MDIQKIKELALANGFSLKPQASGNMDLNAYVYDFANAIEQEAKAQAVPEWISVDDQLPHGDTMVLICWIDSPDVETEKDFMDVCVDTGVMFWSNYLNDPPTHWMYLPEAPKAQEQYHD